jgi:two-component system response regulator
MSRSARLPWDEPGTRAILLVEDNPDDVALTLRALKKCGVSNEVVVARDGVEALDHLFATRATAPQLILLDLKLPRLSGLEVLTRLRENEQTRFLPIVILTSSKEQRDVADGYSLGANGYIRKPVDFGEFVQVMEQLKLYWLTLNEPPPKDP